jgi:hypothetical protein
MKSPTRNMKLEDLIPDDKNANRGTERGLGMLEDSLRTYGAGRSILLDKNGKIIAGNKTIQSAADCGFTDVVVVPSDGRTIIAVQRTDLDMDADPRARELAIADNRVGQVDLDWDPQVLADLDVDLSKFWSQEELDELLAEVQGNSEPVEAPEPQIDHADELREKWRTDRGQVWEIPSARGEGSHRLMCGDSTSSDVALLCDGLQVQAIVTSPPYGVGMEYEGKPDESKTCGLIESVFRQWLPLVKPDGFSFVNFGERYIWSRPMVQFYVELFKAQGWRWYDQRFWKRSQAGMAIWNTTQPRAMSQVEYLFTFQNGTKIYPVHDLSISKEQLWDDSGSSAGTDHPAVMALGIAQKAVTIYSKPGDIIGEPFVGSGTTICSAEQLGRICYGMEIEPKYVAVALQRMADMGLQPKCLSVKPTMPDEQAKRGSTSKNSSSKAKSS